MDIWFAVVSLHVQRPDLIQFNSLIHPLSGMCDTSIKQFCQIISIHISSHISDLLSQPKIFHSMGCPLQFHLKSGLGNMGGGMTIVPLLCRTALFALIHPDKDNRSQLSRATDFIITLEGLCDRSVPTGACQEKPIRTLNQIRLINLATDTVLKSLFHQCRRQQIF